MIREALGEVRAPSEFVRPRQSLAVVLDDPDDDRILECALEASADIIVGGDRHLLGLGTFRSISIVTLASFLTSRPWA